MPRPGRAGHLAYNHAIIGYLTGAGHRVTVLLTRPRLDWPVQRRPAWPEPSRLALEGPGLVARAGVVAMRRPGDIARCLAARAAGLLPSGLHAALRRRARSGSYGAVDAVLGSFVDDAASAWCAARIAALRPRAVLIDTIFRAPVLRDARLRGEPSVLLTQDVFHARHASLSAQGYRLYPPALTAEGEAGLLALAGTVAAIQPEEAAVFRAMLPKARVIVAGMPVRLRPRPPGQPREPDRLVFVGSASLPNVDGLRWFLATLWPRLRARRPDARLDVCGEVCFALAADHPGVDRLGRVDDLAPVLHRASLAIAPLRAGSGLKIKLLDYLAHGLAVVTTPAGAAGLPASDAVLPVEIAGEAATVALIDRLLGADALAREPAALALAARYDPKTAFAELGAVLGA